MPHKTLSEYLYETFGCKVYKISLSVGGLTCPNRDGTAGVGGCIFCLNGSGDFAESISINDSAEEIINAVYCGIEAGKAQTQKKAPECRKFIAYFQSYTNTYANPGKLESLFKAAASHPDIVAVSIGTRPDCLQPDILELISCINKIKPVFVELGLQTSGDKTAEIINRGYRTEVYCDAVKSLKKIGVNVVTHIIIGLPNESFDDYVNTVNCAVASGTDGIKIQALNILKGTRLAELYEKMLFPVLKHLNLTNILILFQGWLNYCLIIL